MTPKEVTMIKCSLRRSRRLALATVLIGMALSVAPAGAAYQPCPGINVVQSAAQSFVAASQTRDPTAFASALSRYGDINAVALFALGPFRRSLPPDRRAEYVAKTQVFLGRILADHAEQFGSAELQIESCGDGQIRSVFGGQNIVWKLSGNRVSDVQVDGIWLAVRLRSKFVSVIRRGHGDIEALFDYLDRNS